MKIVGIICEYNPFHLGHAKQIRLIREKFGPETAVVCLMSGNFVQRGHPAILDKSLRAKAAVLCGADLVLELPVTCALSSAEGFAAGGVAILGGFCDYLCFGCETGTEESLMAVAKALLSAEFPPLLRQELEKGVSFPAARAAALERMDADAQLVRNPNDILAVEYCKAILEQNAAMRPLPIFRQGSYHAVEADPENPSATALRQKMLSGEDWQSYVPTAAVPALENGALHTIQAGERAALMRLRTMTEPEFEALPYGSEGLWRKFMHACRRERTLADIAAAVKSKRYTATRIDRMLLCAALGITREDLQEPAPYIRTLAFNDRGRSVLKSAKQHIHCINAGETPDSAYWALEKRCADLYALFVRDAVEPPCAEEHRRVYYHKENP